MKKSKSVFFFVFLILLVLISLVFAACSGVFSDTADVFNPQDYSTVILDAGHGGEDGGAVSASGIYEKDINLSLTLLLRDKLTEKGITVILTREEDRLLYDRNSDYQGHKKTQDLAARRKLADETPDSLFVSIHMNAFPQTQYKGLQVWYSPNHPLSEALAKTVQDTVHTSLQPENDRQIKAANSNIFLLHHLTSPAILVECGFLSNPEEASSLNTPEYREQLANVLCEAILSFLQG